jgi:hypothetical protein
MAQPPIAIAGYQVSFPYKPYGTQLGFMNQFLRAVDQQGNALLEAPTGSGKTACLLASALAWQRRQIEAAGAVKARNLARAIARAKHGKGGGGAAAAAGDNAGKGAAGAGGSNDGGACEVTEELDEPSPEDEEEEVPKVPKIYYATRTHSQIAQVGSRLCTVVDARLAGLGGHAWPGAAHASLACGHV